ncbi:glutathione S-transferase T3-like [Asparagus officinalis]|uniref:glutathione S-transferase T3-like n=1 Tax=Asparagus officinalis TaxID=4686 RepID=UPI00098E0A28|nr:glutathione S-transferase T3-like [Asparagus officinalis]
MQAPENTQNAGMQPNFQMPYMMPPNFGMQYPYLPYGYHPAAGSSYVPSHMNFPTTESIEPPTPRFSSGSTEIPDFSTQISLGNVGGDTPHSFLPPTQQPTKRSSYDSWSTEDNIILLTAYFHASNDSELGNNQKSETFWGKITQYVNENGKSGKERTRTIARCQSHYKDINRKISSFIGCYSTACREKQSGWSDENYISKGRELYFEKMGTSFNLVDEWKVVRNQPKYMPGVAVSGSSGSKRKSSSEDVESSAPTLVRPEGRDTTKKKARASSSKPRKSKVELLDELSNIVTSREKAEANRASTVEAMNVLARAKNMETWRFLKNKPDRDDEDEEAYQLLRKELFGK